MSNIYKNYNPDILETIANLSNDEVFTPPKVAREMLDMLPKEVWSNPNLTFLDPAVKTGIFLREITSRLIEGLADEIPDLQERVNHILTKQVFGIGITELTTLMARRTVYCSTTANGPFSICTEFDNEKGNIIFPDTEHTWDKNGRCEYCGASEENYSGGADRENYAYPFIHDNFEKEFGNMKFDVIIGNPPYQLDVGKSGDRAFHASAIYHLFIDKAIDLNPKYITMITPSRWMTNNAEGVPSSWVEKMIKSNKIKEIHDYPNGEDIFKNVSIASGVNYFLWDINHNDKCNYFYHDNGRIANTFNYLNNFSKDFILRNPIYIEVINKINKKEKDYFKNNKNFSSLVSPGHFFDKNGVLSSNWKGYKEQEDEKYNVKFYISQATNKIDIAWINPKDIHKNFSVKNINKVYIPGAHLSPQVLGRPRYGEPNSVCSQTYLVIGYDEKKHNFTKEECLNIMSYIRTKFFRFMVNAKKTTQSGPKGVYQFVPLQDFSKPWTDEELYKKYKLSEEEIAYIEDNIESME